jgi:phosphohistidine phosphatase SixA
MTYLSRIGCRMILLTVLVLGAVARPAAAAPSSCPGDCNGDGEVTVDELVRGVNIALGTLTLDACPALDRNGDGQVTIEELLAAVSVAINGCAPVPTATSTGTAVEGTPTITGTIIVEATSTPTITITGTIVATRTATPDHTVASTATSTAEPTETEPPTPTPIQTPSGEPSDLIVVIDGSEVRLAWTNADPSGGYTQALVLRRLNAPVDGPEDPQATLVFIGHSATATHLLTDLLPSVHEQTRVYHYAVFPCTAQGECGSDGAAATLSPTLPEALRGGGYVLHWRNAFADVCRDHTELGTAANPIVPDWWKSCEADCARASAQQLSDSGRAQATEIGRAFDILRVPVGRVVSTEFCRGVTTAELMDLGPPVEQSPSLTYFVYDEAQRCADSYALLQQTPAAGTNTALIGHAGFAPPCSVLSTLAQAEAAVFKPDGQGATAFVTRVTASEWNDLLPSGPSALSANLDTTHVRLTWANGPAYPTVRLLRRLNAAVDGPNDPDAQLVYAGVADTVLDPLVALLPNTPQTSRFYHYAVYGCVGASCETVGSQTIISPTIVDALRAGGYVIFWRHATAVLCTDRTDLGTADTTTVPDWWKSCDTNCPADNPTATARQLSDVGRDQATTVGAAFATRGIPIGRVLSSEFCRAVQTAELMDFGPPIEESQALTFFVYDEADRCADTFQLLAQKPPSDGNTALIGHAGNTCPPLSTLSMGSAAIYKPNGSGAPIFIDTVISAEWETLP